MQEKFKDVQVVVRSHKSRVKQYNDLMKKDKRTINNLQKNNSQKNENWETGTPLKPGVDSVGLPSVLQLYLLALFLSSIADTE
jgi:hypothetical protein